MLLSTTGHDRRRQCAADDRQGHQPESQYGRTGQWILPLGPGFIRAL